MSAHTLLSRHILLLLGVCRVPSSQLSSRLPYGMLVVAGSSPSRSVCVVGSPLSCGVGASRLT